MRLDDVRVRWVCQYGTHHEGKFLRVAGRSSDAGSRNLKISIEAVDELAYAKNVEPYGGLNVMLDELKGEFGTLAKPERIEERIVDVPTLQMENEIKAGYSCSCLCGWQHKELKTFSCVDQQQGPSSAARSSWWAEGCSPSCVRNHTVGQLKVFAMDASCRS